MGTDYRKSSHTTFRIELHLVWVTKYRYKILTKAIGTRTSKLVQQLKGKSSRMLQIEFPELGKRYWGQRMWARGYFAISTGNVTTEMIKEYIKHHFENKEGQDDPFRVEVP